MGKHYSDVIHDEDVSSVGHSFAERRTGERATDRLEVRLRSRSGATRDVEMDIRQFSLSSSGMYQDSQFIGTHGVVRDITTRKYNEIKTANDLDRAIWGMARVDDIHIILEGIRSAMQTVELPFSEFGVSVIDMADPQPHNFTAPIRVPPWNARRSGWSETRKTTLRPSSRRGNAARSCTQNRLLKISKGKKQKRYALCMARLNPSSTCLFRTAF